MNRIDSYEDLAEQIVNWIKDYYWDNDLGGLVVGVSGGIDSAVVSTLCARTGLPTYVLTMTLDSKKENTEILYLEEELVPYNKCSVNDLKREIKDRGIKGAKSSKKKN